MNQFDRNKSGTRRLPQHAQIKGVGIGLRSEHMDLILREQPQVPWFEILIDNYFCDGGPALTNLDRLCQLYPVAFHSVGMSLAGTDKMDFDWFRRMRSLINRYQPKWVSDHLCWTNNSGHYFNDLLPFPLTGESLAHVAARVNQAQELLGIPLIVENVSSYISYKESTLSEAEFLGRLSKQTGCGILLDINNIYVSSYNNANNSHDPAQYLLDIPIDSVWQFHLAGFEDMGEYLLDTHSTAVHKPVWDLYKLAIERFGNVPALIEWDNNIPAFSVLQNQAFEAEKINLKLSTTDSEI